MKLKTWGIELFLDLRCLLFSCNFIRLSTSWGKPWSILIACKNVILRQSDRVKFSTSSLLPTSFEKKINRSNVRYARVLVYFFTTVTSIEKVGPVYKGFLLHPLSEFHKTRPTSSRLDILSLTEALNDPERLSPVNFILFSPQLF